MQNNSNRRVNFVFFLLTSAAENHAGGAYCFTIHAGNKSVSWALHVLQIFCTRQFGRIIERADISSLQRNHLSEFLECLARGNESLSVQFSLRHGRGGSAQMKHPTGKFDAQFFEIVWAMSMKHFENLDHLERISYVGSERLIHISD